MSSWLFVKSVYTYLLLRYGPRAANRWWWVYHAYAWSMATGMAVILFVVGVRDPAVIGDSSFECWIGPKFPKLRFAMQYPLFWIHFAASAVLYMLVIQRNRALRKGSAQSLFQHMGAMATPETVTENCAPHYNQADANLTFGNVDCHAELAEIGCDSAENDTNPYNSDKDEKFEASFESNELPASGAVVTTSSKTLASLLMDDTMNDSNTNSSSNNSNSNIHSVQAKKMVRSYSLNYPIADSRVTALRKSLLVSPMPHHKQMPEGTPSSHVQLSLQFPTPSTQTDDSRSFATRKFGSQDGVTGLLPSGPPVRKRQSMQPAIKSKSSQQLANADKKLFTKASLTLVGFLVSWTPATVARTVGLVKPDYDPPFWLEMMMGFGFAISGLWNVGIFFLVWFGSRSKKLASSNPNNEKTSIIK
ncbi:hypothetical protein HK100_008797 [Physocladia obscura]|uniref:G-protein coupled receptors family 2 profile 2 domain-containing protein n=1 Tax=Physocladia obscura TaxID=109957 RepID=A0AAD5SMX8_9FUNG|nr:hypothetical protein HK100_008797 [Physocladia obscura]